MALLPCMLIKMAANNNLLISSCSQLFSSSSSSLNTIRFLLIRKSMVMRTFLAAPKYSNNNTNNNNQTITENCRRSASYLPNRWNFEFLSKEIDPEVEAEEKVEERAKELEKEVRWMVMKGGEDMEGAMLLELIDNVQRLGLGYKFDTEIKATLHNMFIASDFENNNNGLHATALAFRLLRQHGFPVSQDVFKRFKDNNGEGEFKGEINSDVEGLLSLYEASYVGFEDENVLEEARKFSKTHLIKNLFKQGANNITNKVTHALELPYHRRVHRLEARWFIQNFQEKQSHDRVLLQLAKLDYNIVQSLMKKELQEILRWWIEIGLSKKMDFVRDRLMEVYFWAIGMVPDPQLSHCRKFVTKMFGLVTIIDDVYDVYATLPELQLFTHAVQRWDVNAVNTLPDYMKLIFLALFNSVNDMAYITLRENGHNCLPYLAKSWCELCKAFLQEATWCNKKIIPPFDAYLQNASISSSGGALLAPCYFLLASQPAVMDDSIITSNYLVRSSCTIFRLYNDLATLTAEVERGETTNSIVSYMNEKNGSCEEHEAREKLKELIEKEWKKMNGECARVTLLPAAFKEIAINMARVSQCTYQYGDALGRPDDSARNRINLLLLQPIPIT